MTTSELISYIRKQIQNNIPKDLIISNLLDAGWRLEDINEGFLSADLYHEPLQGDNFFEIKKELPKVEVKKIEIKDKEKEVSKIWVPIRVPVKEKSIEVQELELPGKKEEFVAPTVPPKVSTAPFDSMSKSNLQNNSLKSLSEIAMLSSYKSDLLSLTKQKESVIKEEKHKSSKKWKVVVSLIILILALATIAFAGGFINIKNFNILSIKKDPKILLLNNSKTLASLKSYKTETNIEVSSPSLSNISYGLVSGEAVSSPDKDSILINTLGMIDQNEQGLLSDNFITIKGSLLPDYITTDVKNNGSELFISVPDLKQVIGKNAPESSVVKINGEQFNLVTSLFSSKIKTQLEKINIYKILSDGIPSYINNDTLAAYDGFMNNVEVIEKGQENIKGIDTYHYSISADRQLAKSLLSKISNNFTLNLSDEDKSRFDQILGSIVVDSFDVWIGKGDNNIYQYNVILDIPLSKIVGFEDKSIGDNIIKITWKTTYYDFNISNNISIPKDFILATDFVNNFKKNQIKNDVLSFTQLANSLFQIEKTYGIKPNLNGSCMNPTASSLFSPLGHNKNATTAISSISLLLNKILESTNENGFCYSTGKAWSFTVPISDNYDKTSLPEGGYQSFYCVDSTGDSQDLTAIPTGTACLPKVDTSKTTIPVVTKPVTQ